VVQVIVNNYSPVTKLIPNWEREVRQGLVSLLWKLRTPGLCSLAHTVGKRFATENKHVFIVHVQIVPPSFRPLSYISRLVDTTLNCWLLQRKLGCNIWWLVYVCFCISYPLFVFPNFLIIPHC
jgi:hypothetical protein